MGFVRLLKGFSLALLLSVAGTVQAEVTVYTDVLAGVIYQPARSGFGKQFKESVSSDWCSSTKASKICDSHCPIYGDRPKCLAECQAKQNTTCDKRKTTVPTFQEFTDSKNETTAKFAGVEKRMKTLEELEDKLMAKVGEIPGKLLKSPMRADIENALRKEFQCEIRKMKSELKAEILTALGKPSEAPVTENCAAK